jgi:hypothetical protein
MTDMPNLVHAVEEAVELLCSAHAIASRKGAQTNWPAFMANAEKCLARFGRSTATPRTYRLVGDNDPSRPSEN